MAETPFRIDIPQADIELLQAKLASTRLPDKLEGVGRSYGVPLADIRRLVEFWKAGYDWRKHEKALNDEMPQYTRDIDVSGYGTLNVHYVHKRSEVGNAIPLLFCHGWPGSFLEVRKVLPLLTNSPVGAPRFHVVALSLPGYGFSEAPKKKGFGISSFAEVAHKLMISLGYDEYVVQGGDWGSVIGREMASTYGPKHCKAYHSNMPLPNAQAPKQEVQRAGLARFSNQESAYFQLQSTKPQTIGYALADSPVALLSWIYEKLVTWTDNYPWTDDEVLTWISIYWFSRAGPAASLRIYKEVRNTFRSKGAAPSIKIPTGYSHFPAELIVYPRKLQWIPKLVFEKEHTRGGHFAAYEVPELLVGDLQEMFGKSGPAFGVVPGNTGYPKTISRL